MNHELKVFFGNHKCASTFMITIVERMCRESGWKYSIPYWYDMSSDKADLYKVENGTDFFIFPESNISKMSNLPCFKGIHICRDPRDICVSAYFSHLYSHAVPKESNLERHREKLKKLNEEDGLIAEFQYSKQNLENIFSWNYEDERIYEIKFEDMIENNNEILLEAFNFIGCLSKEKTTLLTSFRAYLNRIHFKYPLLQPWKFPERFISEQRLIEIIEKNSFENKSKGRKKGQEDKRSHYRKGVSGDWKNYFTSRCKDEFKRMYGDNLIMLGYENDNNW